MVRGVFEMEEFNWFEKFCVVFIRIMFLIGCLIAIVLISPLIILFLIISAPFELVKYIRKRNQSKDEETN